MTKFRFVNIKSDSSDATYTVKVRLSDNKAVYCNCPARRGCKHLERAELLPAFLKARKAFEAVGMSRADFNAKFEATVASLKARSPRFAVNLAIKRVIEKAPKLQPCKRCGGTGIMPYPHVCNGMCFRCKGMKVEAQYGEARSEDKPRGARHETYQEHLRRRVAEYEAKAHRAAIRKNHDINNLAAWMR